MVKKKKKALDLDVLHKSSRPKKCFFRRLIKGVGAGRACRRVLVLLEMISLREVECHLC